MHNMLREGDTFAVICPAAGVDQEFCGLVAESNSKLPDSSSQECGMGDHNPSRGGVRGIKGVCCYGKEYTEGVAGVDIL